MPPKRNPMNLNPLQLKTLTLVQALALLPDAKPGEEDGSVLLTEHTCHFGGGENGVSSFFHPEK